MRGHQVSHFDELNSLGSGSSPAWRAEEGLWPRQSTSLEQSRESVPVLETRYLKPWEGGREGQQSSLGPDFWKTLSRQLNQEEDVTHQTRPGQLPRALTQPSHEVMPSQP